MDAVDAVLVEFNNTTTLIASHSHPISVAIRQQLLTLIGTHQLDLCDYGTLDVSLGKLFAEACQTLLQNSGIAAEQISAIGSHGQTIHHSPNSHTPFTLQIGDPNNIAQLTGITTIADFRRRDMAAGGQGAPLVPAFHNAIFRSPEQNRVILNIGGIANITILPSNPQHAVRGFDTGPGNCLMDEWINKQQQHNFDKKGDWAASGHLDQELLKQFLEDNYFSAPPPKSNGREYFNLHWHNINNYSGPAQNMQATLAQLSIETIAQAIEQQAPHCDEIYVCGGGAHNNHLMSGLRNRLNHSKLNTTNALGIHPDWVEAIAFAWLAKQTLTGLPGNLPNVTGASTRVILGAIYPA